MVGIFREYPFESQCPDALHKIWLQFSMMNRLKPDTPSLDSNLFASVYFCETIHILQIHLVTRRISSSAGATALRAPLILAPSRQSAWCAPPRSSPVCLRAASALNPTLEFCSAARVAWPSANYRKAISVRPTLHHYPRLAAVQSRIQRQNYLQKLLHLLLWPCCCNTTSTPSVAEYLVRTTSLCSCYTATIPEVTQSGLK